MKKGEETAEDMTSDRLVPLVKGGTGAEHALDVPEDLLHLPDRGCLPIGSGCSGLGEPRSVL